MGKTINPCEVENNDQKGCSATARCNKNCDGCLCEKLIYGDWDTRNVDFGQQAFFTVFTSDQVNDNSNVMITLCEKNVLHRFTEISQNTTVTKGKATAAFLIKYEYMQDLSQENENSELKFYCRVQYQNEIKNFQYNNPLIVKSALCDGCSYPQDPKTFPYTDNVFDLISQIAPLIIYYSNLYNVPPVAVAGSIADEYNTRKSFRAAWDWFQDEVLLNWAPNFAIEFDAYLNINSKWLNLTKHDLGIGNIKLETAKQLYDEYRFIFENQNWDYTDLVDYIRSDEGTVHLAALVIRKAKLILHEYIVDYDTKKQESIFVTYYKQGDNYVTKFLNNLKENPNHKIKPGEGCRVCLQRLKFLKALNMSE